MEFERVPGLVEVICGVRLVQSGSLRRLLVILCLRDIRFGHELRAEKGRHHFELRE
jgi:hypothetical protein